MLARLGSDFHLEQFRGRDLQALEIDLLPKDPRDKDAVLILAGDISSIPDQLVGFIKLIEPRFKHVLFIPGNHEYYRHDYTAWNLEVRDRMAEHLANTTAALGDVQVKILNGVRYIFSTLWADGGKDSIDRKNVERGLWDFTVIKHSGRAFTVAGMIKIHKQHKKDIIFALKIPFEGKTVVVTHHMPSYRLCHPRFGNEINGGFASNCDDILAYDFAPNVWMHGHTHDKINLRLWKTLILCNPSGYTGEYCNGYSGGEAMFIDFTDDVPCDSLSSPDE
jgi:hypothetical protein